jgi:hypothetical protein
MYGCRDAHFLRQESLRGDFLDFLDSRQLLTPDLEQFVKAGAPLNVTPHGATPSYYNDLLIHELAARERPVVERFGYVFDRNSAQ